MVLNILTMPYKPGQIVKIIRNELTCEVEIMPEQKEKDILLVRTPWGCKYITNDEIVKK